MKKILALVLLAALAAPASAAWTYDGNDGNNIWATDGTWRIKFIKNGSTYYIGGWEDGGATLDLSTVYEDLAAEETPHVVTFSNIGNQCVHVRIVVSRNSGSVLRKINHLFRTTPSRQGICCILFSQI